MFGLASLIEPILRLDIDGKVIDKWEAIKHMCRELDKHKINDAAVVVRVAKGKQNYHKGFKYKII